MTLTSKSLFLGLAVAGLALPARADNDTFNKKCASCHGKDGKGATAMGKKLGIKDLTVTKLDEAGIASMILDGKKGDDGKQKMPAFKEKGLSADDAKGLAAFIKGGLK